MEKLKKQLTIYFITIAFLWLGCYNVSIAQKQLEVSVKVSPLPNYYPTANKSKVEYLSDGKFSVLNPIWKDVNTLGWNNVNQININLNLKQKTYINNIVFNTAEGFLAGVQLPLNVLVFSLKEEKNYTFLGDMMEGVGDGDGKNKTLKLALNDVNIYTDNVTIIVNIKSKFFFCDEIQLLGGLKGKQHANFQQIDNISSFVETKRKTAINRELLLKTVQDKSKESPSNNSVKSLMKEIETDKHFDNPERQAYYQSKINNVVNGVNSKDNSISVSLLKDMWAKNPKPITTKGDLTRLTLPTLINATQFVAFQLINQKKQDAVFKIVNSMNPNLKIEFYVTKDVKARDFQTIPDALEKIDMNNPISVSGGESKNIYVSLKPLKAGVAHHKISVIEGTANKVGQFDVTLNTKAERINRADLLNVNTWAYFNYSFYKGKENVIRNDLLDHYNNVFVIPPSAISLYNLAQNKVLLQSYLTNLKGFNKVLLFLNFNLDQYRLGKNYMNDSWKVSFLKWYDETTRMIEDKGVKDVYIYPFDEITNNEADKFIEFAKWLKSTRKDAKLYATFLKPGLIDKVGRYVDIGQLHNSDDLLTEYSKSQVRFKNSWYYDTKGPAKSLSPYSYYRLMAWKAYLFGFNGIGFWNYADIKDNNGKKSAWDDFSSSTGNYNVVYDVGSNNIMTSRRWEAFKIGIEDYNILMLFQKKFGREKTMNLCRQVLDNVSNESKADEVRRIMLENL